MGRWQPPVHSPLSAGALAAGAAALLGGRTDEADLIDRLRQAHGSKDALRTDSGTTALTLALRHLGREHPREELLAVDVIEPDALSDRRQLAGAGRAHRRITCARHTRRPSGSLSHATR